MTEKERKKKSKESDELKMDPVGKSYVEMEEPISPVLSTDLSFIYGENYFKKSLGTQSNIKPLGPALEPHRTAASYEDTPGNAERQKKHQDFAEIPSISTSKKQQFRSSFDDTADYVCPTVVCTQPSAPMDFIPPSTTRFSTGRGFSFLGRCASRTGLSTPSGFNLNALRVKVNPGADTSGTISTPYNPPPVILDDSALNVRSAACSTAYHRAPLDGVNLSSLRVKLDYTAEGTTASTANCDEQYRSDDDALADDIVISGSIDSPFNIHLPMAPAVGDQVKRAGAHAITISTKDCKNATAKNFSVVRSTPCAPETDVAKCPTILASVPPQTNCSSNSAVRSTLQPPLQVEGLPAVLMVNGHQYIVMKIIGEGGSCKVYEVYNSAKHLRAIKVVKLSKNEDDNSQTYLNEIALLKKLQGSSRVIRLYDYEHNVENRALYVVLERGDVDLGTLIRSTVKHDQITAEMVKFYWSEMLRAVQVIHEEGIIHSDLKPGNFLIVKGHLKIIDFGISSSIPDDVTSIIKDTATGTPSYMSPEALKDTSAEGGPMRIKIGVKSDVWSLGCILYHIVHGRTPFSHIRHSYKLFDAIINPKHPIQFPQVADPLLDDVLKKCIVRDPKQRCSIAELLDHPFLADGMSSGIKQNKKVESLVHQISELSPESMKKISEVINQMSISKAN